MHCIYLYSYAHIIYAALFVNARDIIVVIIALQKYMYTTTIVNQSDAGRASARLVSIKASTSHEQGTLTWSQRFYQDKTSEFHS